MWIHCQDGPVAHAHRSCCCCLTSPPNVPWCRLWLPLPGPLRTSWRSWLSSFPSPAAVRRPWRVPATGGLPGCENLRDFAVFVTRFWSFSVNTHRVVFLVVSTPWCARICEICCSCRENLHFILLTLVAVYLFVLAWFFSRVIHVGKTKRTREKVRLLQNGRLCTASLRTGVWILFWESGLEWGWVGPDFLRRQRQRRRLKKPTHLSAARP